MASSLILLFYIGLPNHLSYGQDAPSAKIPQGLQELWRVGAPGDDILFDSILDLAVDSKGSVHVVDWSHPAVYVFSGNDGTLLQEVGKKGKGPDEFTQVGSVFIGKGDSLFVFDHDNGRISLFSPESYDFVESLRISSMENLYPLSLVGVVSNGFLLSFTSGFQDGTDNQANQFRDAYLIDRKGEKILSDPIVSMQNLGVMVHESRDGGYAMISHPFRVTPHMRVSGQGRMYFSQGDINAVSVYSENGVLEDSLRWNRDLVPITSRELRTERRKLSRRWRRVLEDLGRPKFKPAVQNLVVDGQEQVWVHLSAAEGETTALCLVLDLSGHLISSVELPLHLRLKAIRNGKAYGILSAKDGSDILVAYVIS